MSSWLTILTFIVSCRPNDWTSSTAAVRVRLLTLSWFGSVCRFLARESTFHIERFLIDFGSNCSGSMPVQNCPNLPSTNTEPPTRLASFLSLSSLPLSIWPTPIRLWLAPIELIYYPRAPCTFTFTHKNTWIFLLSRFNIATRTMVRQYEGTLCNSRPN